MSPDALFRMLGYVNQYKILGLTRQSTFLVGAGKDTRAVLNVSSHDQSHLSLVEAEGVIADDSIDPRFEVDTWSEVIDDHFTSRARQPRTYHVSTKFEPVTVIGFISKTDVPDHWNDEPMHEGLDWVDPLDSNKAGYLVHLTPEVRRGSVIVLMNNRGQVACIGPILGQAFVEL